MSEHIPGPWTIGPRQHYDDTGRLILGGADGAEWLALVTEWPSPDIEGQANARLIAAAPALLAALQQIYMTSHDPAIEELAMEAIKQAES